MLLVFHRLWWKDLQWLRHHLPSTVALVLLPIIATVMFSYILSEAFLGDLSKVHDQQQVMSIVEEYPMEIYEKITVIVHPSIDSTTGHSIERLCGTQCSWFTFEKGRTVSQAGPAAKKTKAKGIVLVKEWNVKTRTLDYEYIDLRWILDRHVDPVWGLYSLDKMTKTFSPGDETLRVIQHLIDTEFYKQCQQYLGRNVTVPTVVRYRADPLFNPSLQMIYSYLGLVSAFTCLLCVWQGSQQVIEERKEGTKALLLHIGISRFQYFAAHFLFNLAKCLLVHVIFWIPPMIFSHNALEWQWILPVILVESLTFAAFTLLVATVFRDKWTSRLGSLGLIIVFHYGHMRTVDLSPSLSFAIPHSLFFPSSYYYYQSIAVERMTGFFSWSAMGAVYSMLTMLLNTVTLLLLMFYFENVSPGTGIEDKTADFIFRKKYWFKKVQPPVYESDEFREISVLEDVPHRLAQTYKHTPRKPTIHIDGVSQIEDDLWLVNRINLKLHLGEVTVLYGPRGGGGREILELLSTKKKTDFGYVKYLELWSAISTGYFPDFICVHRFTVEQTIKWVMGIRGADSNETFTMVEELQLNETLKKPLSSLSASERQSLSVLLCFIGNTRLVLLDEPTKNCTPIIAGVIHEFIIRNTVNRTIVVATYDPQEAEILADVTVFMNEGHMIYSGCTKMVKKKLIKCSNLVVWPSSFFKEEYVTRIADVVSTVLKQPVQFDLMPNECIRYYIPLDVNVPFATIIGELEKVQYKLGIKYCEASHQTLHEAYYKSCSRVADTPTNYEGFVAPIKDKYEGERKPRWWPEFGFVSALKWKHLRRHFSMYLLSLILPLACIGASAAFAVYHHKTTGTLVFDSNFMRNGGIEDGIFVSNLAKSKFSEIPSNTAFRSEKEHFLQKKGANWIYGQPPILNGIFEFGNKFHIVSLQPIRFGEISVSNILHNYMLKQLGGSGGISISISSLDNQKYSFLLPKTKGGTPWKHEQARRLCAILANEYLVIFVVASLLTVCMAQATIFPSRLASDGCIRMHYMIGVRPIMYWITIFLTDLFAFLLKMAIALAVIVVFAGVQDAVILSLCAWCLLSSYISSTPFVYLMSLYSKNVCCSYFVILFLTGILSLVPGLLPMLAMEYGPRFENWLLNLFFLSSLSPPLAAALSCTFIVGLHRQNATPKEIIEFLAPLLILCIVHIWTWLLVFTINSTKCTAFFTRTKFALKHATMRPKDLLSIENAPKEVPKSEGIVPKGDPNQNQEVTPESKKQQPSTGNHEEFRSDGGMDPPVEEQSNGPSVGQQSTMNKFKLRQMSSVNHHQIREQFKVATMRLGVSGSKSAMSALQKPQEEPETLTTRMAVDQRMRISENRSILGLWDKRDQIGEQTPVVQWNNVPLAHYKMDIQRLQISLYESQALNVFGDLPEARSLVLDMAAGQSAAFKGTVLVNGKPVGCGKGSGYVPRDNRLCTFLTGREILTMNAKMKNYVKVDEIVNLILQVAQLTEVADQTIYAYSVSNRRMLSFGIAIIDRPTVLILDELDMYISPNRMKIVWSIVRLLRSALKVPVIFSTPRVFECETAASHTVMMFRGAVSIADTTLAIKKRFTGLAILTVTLKKAMNKMTTMNVICAQVGPAAIVCLTVAPYLFQLECQIYPHPRPEKISFLLAVAEGGFAATLAKIGALMHTIGIDEFYFVTPDLDTIYNANFS